LHLGKIKGNLGKIEAKFG